MPRKLRVISTSKKDHTYAIISPEEKMSYEPKVTDSILESAQETWAEIWNELEGEVVCGTLITPEAEKGLFKPKIGWPEFLEKMWLLKHYLDNARNFCNPVHSSNDDRS